SISNKIIHRIVQLKRRVHWDLQGASIKCVMVLGMFQLDFSQLVMGRLRVGGFLWHHLLGV
ncbi:hypothetical protein TorRG33x02_248760, partial [Trema orientale]